MRAAAVGSLARLGRLAPPDLATALADEAPEVRRRAAQEAGRLGRPGAAETVEALCRSTADGDPLVAEMAAWALGEIGTAAAVEPLSSMARRHPDVRCREAAVAALGALGADGIAGGLPAILGALEDRPTIRRRAVVALASFDGPEVDMALQRSLEDRDWQVRQAAETLLGA